MIDNRAQPRKPTPVGLGVLAVAVLLNSCSDGTRTTSPPTSSSTVPGHVGQSSDDARASLNGLLSESDGYRLDVAELVGLGGQAVGIEVFHNDEPLREFESFNGEALHIFAFDPALRYLEHETLPTDAIGTVRWPHWIATNTGRNRIVVAFDGGAGPVALGADVTVTEPSDFDMGHRNANGAVYSDGALTLERDGFDFQLDVPWKGDPMHGAPAWITLVRDSDLSLTFDAAGLIGDRTFHFDPDLPGPGKYLALIEFHLEGVSKWAIEYTIDVTSDMP